MTYSAPLATEPQRWGDFRRRPGRWRGRHAMLGMQAVRVEGGPVKQHRRPFFPSASALASIVKARLRGRDRDEDGGVQRSPRARMPNTVFCRGSHPHADARSCPRRGDGITI
jgi:hypothetical protein